MGLNKISERRRLEYNSEKLRFEHGHLRTRFFTYVVLDTTLLFLFFQSHFKNLDAGQSFISNASLYGIALLSVLLYLTLSEMIKIQDELKSIYKKLMK